MRAVSPLIGAILLIAFTMAVASIVIPWGMNYVKQQTKCAVLAGSLSVKGIQKDYTHNKLILTTVYTAPVPLSVNDMQITLTDSLGNVYICNPTGTAGATCTFSVSSQGTPVQVLSAGKEYKITINLPSGVNVNQITKVEGESVSCASILFTTYIFS